MLVIIITMKMRVELCLLLMFCSIEVNCIPVEEFFPFGASAGDVVLDLGDDDSSDPIPLSPPFPLLGEHRTSLRVGECMSDNILLYACMNAAHARLGFQPSQVNTNGVISLRRVFAEYNSGPFPYDTSGEIIICPFWTDLDSSFRGTISHNSILDTGKMNRITQLIQESFGYSFVSTAVFTATWDAVPYYGTDIIVSVLADSIVDRLDDP